ncbi:hypothetical protein V6N13_140788 [Hibiscus sabdariffa]
MRNPLYWSKRSALELYQDLIQSDHDNNVAVGLPVLLLEVDKGRKQRFLPANQHQHHRVHPLSLSPRSLRFSAIHLVHNFILLWHLRREDFLLERFSHTVRR